MCSPSRTWLHDVIYERPSMLFYRMAYRGVVATMFRGQRVYVAPSLNWRGYDPSWWFQLGIKYDPPTDKWTRSLAFRNCDELTIDFCSNCSYYRRLWIDWIQYRTEFLNSRPMNNWLPLSVLINILPIGLNRLQLARLMWKDNANLNNRVSLCA